MFLFHRRNLVKPRDSYYKLSGNTTRRVPYLLSIQIDKYEKGNVLFIFSNRGLEFTNLHSQFFPLTDFAKEKGLVNDFDTREISLRWPSGLSRHLDRGSKG